MIGKKDRNTEILLRMMEDVGNVIKHHINDLTSQYKEQQAINEEEIINKLDSNTAAEPKKITYSDVRDRIIEIITNDMANKRIIKKYVYEYGVDSFQQLNEDKLGHFMEKLNREFPRTEL